MKKLLGLIGISIVLASCHNFDIQKRRYRSGYTFSHSLHKTNGEATSLRVESLKSEHLMGGVQNKEELSTINNSIKPSIKKLQANGTLSWKSSENVKQRKRNNNIKPHRVNARLHKYNGTFNNAKVNHTNDVGFLATCGAFTLLIGGMLRKKLARPDKLTLWANRNPIKARTAIVASRAGLITSGYWLGSKLLEHDVHVTSTSTGILLGLASTAVILYPSRQKNDKAFGKSGFKHRALTFLITVFGFLSMITVGNRITDDIRVSPIVNRVINDFSDSGHEVTVTTRAAQYDDDEAVLNVLLTILIIALAIVLFYATLILSCNLSCSGQEGAAAGVLLGGILLIILMLIFGIKWIWTPRNQVKNVG